MLNFQQLMRASLVHQEEKDAVDHLLGIQHRPTSGDNRKSPKKRRRHKKSRTAKKTTTSPSRLKPPPVYPSKKRQRQTLEDLLKAQEKIKPPPPPTIPKVFLMDMGKKRKKKSFVEDQFEDAMEPRIPYRGVVNDLPKNSILVSINGKQTKTKRSNTTTQKISYQLQLEKQADERRRDLAQVTALRLKQHSFSPALDPKEVVIFDNNTKKLASKAVGTNSNALLEGIYDDANVSKNDFQSTTPAPRMPIDGPSAESIISVPVPSELQDTDEWTPAFTDTQHHNISRKGAMQQDGFVLSPKDRYEACLPPLTWEEITRAPKMSPVSPDSLKQNPIISKDLGPYDVLDGENSDNSGNARLLKLAQKFRLAYSCAPEGVKRSLAKSILNYVRSKEGRFLERDNSAVMIWYEMGDEKAQINLSQLLGKQMQDLEPPSSPSSGHEVIL